jgi:hydrogenase nickel incorporation protein HypA/HybF
VAVFCAGCAAERELPDTQRFRCPVCGAPTAAVVRGRELDLTAIEYEGAPAAERSPR